MKKIKPRLYLFVSFLMICGLFACKKTFYNLTTDLIFGEFDFSENRPEGIACINDVDPKTLINNELSFDGDHMLCVNLEMDSGDFSVMRNETRFGPAIDDENGRTVLAVFLEYFQQCDVPWPSNFQWYKTNVKIDGLDSQEVGVRKKGFLGSVFSTSPSIKLEINRYRENSELGKTKRITFNNNTEDESRLKSSFNFKLFELLDYPAPRCNLANVSINGDALGTYSHLETIDEDFLEHHFGNSDGDLYEGQLADFVEEWLPRWDDKTEATDEFCAPIVKIVEAFELSDEQFPAEVSKYLNLERFIQFWAMEILLDHIDGYSSNRNNFFVYFDPYDDDRATLIPWGMNYHTSSTEQGLEGLQVFVKAELPRKLSRNDDVRKLFEAEMERIMTEVWDEQFLLDYVETLGSQVMSAEMNSDYSEILEEFKVWIIERRAVVRELLDDGFPIGEEKIAGICI